MLFPAANSSPAAPACRVKPLRHLLLNPPLQIYFEKGVRFPQNALNTCTGTRSGRDAE
jgi:hypothetical protein